MRENKRISTSACGFCVSRKYLGVSMLYRFGDTLLVCWWLTTDWGNLPNGFKSFVLRHRMMLRKHDTSDFFLIFRWLKNSDVSFVTVYCPLWQHLGDFRAISCFIVSVLVSFVSGLRWTQSNDMLFINNSALYISISVNTEQWRFFCSSIGVLCIQVPSEYSDVSFVVTFRWI